MTTNSMAISYGTEVQSVPKGAVVLVGRFLFGMIFIASGFSHFSKEVIGFAASQGVPLASLAVPFSGIMAMLGGLSILLGYRAELGAWLIVIFLLPVTFMMHNFWAVADPIAAQDQMAHFMKNMSMLGAALFISQVGTGPLSLDARRSR